MAHTQAADAGDGLQIWRVAANILNKQSQTTDEGWPSSLGVWRGVNNSSPQKIILLGNVTKGLQHEQILWMNDASKMHIRLGTWYVRILNSRQSRKNYQNILWNVTGPSDANLPRVRVSAASNWSRRCLDDYGLFNSATDSYTTYNNYTTWHL
jgi:hypothetical protein